MCYCSKETIDIVSDIVKERVPDEALGRACCWSSICGARGLSGGMVGWDDWRELCRRRGYILYSR